MVSLSYSLLMEMYFTSQKMSKCSLDMHRLVTQKLNQDRYCDIIYTFLVVIRWGEVILLYILEKTVNCVVPLFKNSRDYILHKNMMRYSTVQLTDCVLYMGLINKVDMVVCLLPVGYGV